MRKSVYTIVSFKVPEEEYQADIFEQVTTGYRRVRKIENGDERVVFSKTEITTTDEEIINEKACLS